MKTKKAKKVIKISDYFGIKTEGPLTATKCRQKVQKLKKALRTRKNLTPLMRSKAAYYIAWYSNMALVKSGKYRGTSKRFKSESRRAA
jgi:hypothetical protein